MKENKRITELLLEMGVHKKRKYLQSKLSLARKEFDLDKEHKIQQELRLLDVEESVIAEAC